MLIVMDNGNKQVNYMRAILSERMKPDRSAE